MGVETEIEEFVVSVTPEDEQRIGKLAIEARLLQEEVLVWMEENDCNRKEEAPMWRQSALAFNAFCDAVNELLDLEDARGNKKSRRRR
jgi:hypothetical protein